MEEYIVHYGVKGQKWGVRKAARSKKRAQKLVSKYGTKKAAEEVVKRRARAKQVAKKGALFLGSAVAAYALKQTLYDIDTSSLGLSNAHWQHEQGHNDVIKSIYDRDNETYNEATKKVDKAEDSIYLNREAIKNQSSKAGQWGVVSGALATAGASTKINGQTRKTKRKLKDIKNA